MAKISGDLLQLLSNPDVSVYGNVMAPGKIVVKTPSFPKGEVPSHLTGYVGQTGKVAHACKGRRGMAFVNCLKTKAKEMGVTKGA